MVAMSLRKLLVCPYFGAFPDWMHKFEAPKGYDLMIDVNLTSFKKRVKEKLGIEYPGVYGTGKIWDYRCALGYLYSHELQDYDYWGHCDLDVVWGDMTAFLPDEELSKWDVWSGHNEYVCGCFNMYRNCREVNELFMKDGMWKMMLDKPEPNAWVSKVELKAESMPPLKPKTTFWFGKFVKNFRIP